MTGTEKVIEGFEKLREYADSEVHPVVSPDNWNIYSELRDLIDKAEKDTLALLKAQEPLKPVLDTSYGARPWWFVCGNCKLSVNEDQKYCPNCGRAVKWE